MKRPFLLWLKWHLFNYSITQLGFAFISHDVALFTRQTPHGIVLRFLYVDDVIITDENPQAIHDLQHYLSKHFEMKDLGSLNYFLNLEVSICPDDYLLSQVKYVFDFLVCSRITNSNTEPTSIDSNVNLTPFNDVPFKDVNLERQLIGNLIYLTVARPDIVYLFILLSQFIATPLTIHFNVVMCILRFVNKTSRHRLQFSSQLSLMLFGYSNADWVRDPT